MDDPKTPWSPRHLGRAFHIAEQAAYAAVGVLLVVTIAIALAGAAQPLWETVVELGSLQAAVAIIDRILYVLMLVEILHTVHASLQTGSLTFEPFLIVGLIACVRRILVITLDTSQITQPDKWKPEQLPLFQASMLELALLGMLIVVFVGSIWASRRYARDGQAGPSQDGRQAPTKPRA